jgi:HemY protein
MKYLLWILLLFAAAAALTTASHNPGFVLLVYPPYRVELSLPLFIIMIVLAFIFSYGLVRLTAAALNLPEYVRKFRMERGKIKSRVLLDDALYAFFAGHYAAAEKASARAMELGDASILHPIIAARSAHEFRAYEKRDTYLSAADDNTAKGSILRLIATAKFRLDQHDPKGALSTLQELREAGIKNHPGALALELKAQQQAGNWDDVLNVLDQLQKRTAINDTTANQLRLQAWLEKIRQQTDFPGLTSCLKNMPSDFKRRAKVASTAARALIQHDGSALAQQLLAESLNAHWESDLVTLYGDCPSDDLIEQIKQAEKWLLQHKDDPELLLVLGKLCLRQKLWGKAKNYLDASLSVSPSHAAYTTLGLLAEQSGRKDEAFKYYQQAAKMTGNCADTN